jgi:hypothetical protein
MKADRTLGVTLILATGLLWALYALGVDSPVRALVAIGYLLVAPGLAVMSLLDLAQRWAAALLAVALSLGIVTVVATALLLANLWTPGRALAIVGCITLLSAAVRLVISSGSGVPVATALPAVERREDGS